jgi:hypothetical protein
VSYPKGDAEEALSDLRLLLWFYARLKWGIGPGVQFGKYELLRSHDIGRSFRLICNDYAIQTYA